MDSKDDQILALFKLIRYFAGLIRCISISESRANEKVSIVTMRVIQKIDRTKLSLTLI